MSQQIRRLHRKQSQFTNFTGSQSTKLSSLSSSTKSTKLNIQNAAEESFKRQSKQRHDNSPANLSDMPSSPNPTEFTEPDTVDASGVATSFFSPLKSDGISSIRAELKEDTYHSKLAESDFTDDTHDWGYDSQDISDDYWHFVGSFE